MYQEVPEFETGYYLASYKCVCRANFEFPFMDYGSGYFEGGTVEKEYEKKVKGLPNIYERLKCRPLTAKNSFKGLFSAASSSHQNFYSSIFATLFVISSSFLF
jgi:hypothetical protein